VSLGNVKTNPVSMSVINRFVVIHKVDKLLHIERVQMPPAHGTFKKAEKVKNSDGVQDELGI
jgi:hypothetical protein